MVKKIKIRWWVFVITGLAFHYLISPMLATIYFTPPLKSDLIFIAWLVALFPIAGDILIVIGVIVGIISWFRKRSTKNINKISHFA